MAELVDALVSNTNEVTLVPVRLRLWVQKLTEMWAFFLNNLFVMTDFYVHALKSLYKIYIYVGMTGYLEKRFN